MPITDDGPCFFCGKTLSNLDGICVCSDGCGAFEQYATYRGLVKIPPEIEWVVPQAIIIKLAKEGRLYS